MASTYTKLMYHIVFSTKDRHPLIDAATGHALHAYMGGIIKNIDGCPLMIGGVGDHVHLLATIPARMSLADTVRTIKANSSKWLHDERNIPRFQWQSGYAAFTVSEAVRPAVTHYIQKQEEHHCQHDFRAELITLLQRHRV